MAELLPLRAQFRATMDKFLHQVNDWHITQGRTNTHSSIDKIKLTPKINQLIMNLYTIKTLTLPETSSNLTTQKHPVSQ